MVPASRVYAAMMGSQLRVTIGEIDEILRYFASFLSIQSQFLDFLREFWRHRAGQASSNVHQVYSEFKRFAISSESFDPIWIMSRSAPLEIAFWIQYVIDDSVANSGRRFGEQSLTHSGGITTIRSPRSLQAVGSFYRDVISKKLWRF
jgi:hypothetical protein